MADMTSLAPGAPHRPPRAGRAVGAGISGLTAAY